MQMKLICEIVWHKGTTKLLKLRLNVIKFDSKYGKGLHVK